MMAFPLSLQPLLYVPGRGHSFGHHAAPSRTVEGQNRNYTSDEDVAQLSRPAGGDSYPDFHLKPYQHVGGNAWKSGCCAQMATATHFSCEASPAVLAATHGSLDAAPQ